MRTWSNKNGNRNVQQCLAPAADFAPAQVHLATLYAQDPSTVAAASDLATKARKALPDDPRLAELLGRLSYEKKEYPRAIQLLQETARKRPFGCRLAFLSGYVSAPSEAKN